MPHLVYILELLNGKLYVGSTSDIDRRLKDHGKGFGDRTTLLGGYKKLLYTESFPTLSAAHSRERQLKGWSHAKKIALASGNLGALKTLSKSKS